jgi:hypothetical protein
MFIVLVLRPAELGPADPAVLCRCYRLDRLDSLDCRGTVSGLESEVGGEVGRQAASFRLAS